MDLLLSLITRPYKIDKNCANLVCFLKESNLYLKTDISMFDLKFQTGLASVIKLKVGIAILFHNL